MRTRSMHLLTGLLAAVALASAVGNSPAARLSVDEQRFRIVWQPLSLYLGEFPVRCNLTLEGSFPSSTFAKTSGVKARTEFTFTPSFGPCTGGTATLLIETLPWEFWYESFSGTLPRIQEVNFAATFLAFKIEYGAGACLIISRREEPVRTAFRVGEGGAVRELVFIRSEIPTQNEICQAFHPRGSVSGTGTITKPGSTQLIHLSLI